MWILPSWLDHAVKAVANTDLTTVTVVWVGDLVADFEHASWGGANCEHHGWGFRFVHVDEGKAASEHRVWNTERYRHMTGLRNALLAEVRAMGPRVFWSLDSDILAHPEALSSALEALSRFSAVGQRCYMSEYGVWCPSYAMVAGEGGLLRRDADGCFPVDCIMAAKVMSPAAYAVDYVFDVQGEDIGWSKACRQAGLSLGWDGRIVSKHVMRPEFFALTDQRCGY